MLAAHCYCSLVTGEVHVAIKEMLSLPIEDIIESVAENSSILWVSHFENPFSDSEFAEQTIN